MLPNPLRSLALASITAHAEDVELTSPDEISVQQELQPTLACPALTPCAVAGTTCAGVCDALGQCAVERCFDNADNDGDGQTDCADVMNCPLGTACLRNNGAQGTCQSNRNCN